MTKHRKPTRAEKHESKQPSPRFTCHDCGAIRTSKYALKQHKEACRGSYSLDSY